MVADEKQAFDNGELATVLLEIFEKLAALVTPSILNLFPYFFFLTISASQDEENGAIFSSND